MIHQQNGAKMENNCYSENLPLFTVKRKDFSECGIVESDIDVAEDV